MKSTNPPCQVAVVIPCYNNTEGLKKSLSSIYSKYRTVVVVVDDGSSVRPSEDELTPFLNGSVELRLLSNEKNLGIERSLNKGLKFAKEELEAVYIARLDAGDTCHPSRLDVQAEYLDKHQDIALLGSWVEMVDMEGRYQFTFSTPTSHEKISKKMFLTNCFIHPAVMFRASAIDVLGYYPLEYKAAEDFAYFFRFVKEMKVAVLDQVLLTCEMNPSGISIQKRKIQVKSRLRVILANFNYHPYAFLGLVKDVSFLVLPHQFVTWVKKAFY